MARGKIKRYSIRRKFGGENFKFVDSFHYKPEAERLKRQIKDRGHRARIIKTKHGYEVWAR